VKPKPLSIDLLQTDADTQSRIAINEEAVEDYAEVISASKKWPLPPLDVFHDGNRYMVADGFHRVLGATKAKRASVPCNVHKGTATEARIFGMTANDKHGLRMTRDDKRSCVEWLLDNGGKMTQKAIATAAGVATRTVKRIVAERNESSVSKKGTLSPRPTSRGGSEFDDEQEWEDVDDIEDPVGDTVNRGSSLPPKPPAKIGEECPNCGRKKWREEKCVKCGHVLGEALGDRDQQYVDERLAAAITYGEHLLRAIGDARESATESQHSKALDLCDQILTELKGWKK